MVETWRDVVGYEGRYRVSDQGNVWSCLTNRLLHQQSTWQGKLQVTLVPATGKANKRTLSVHRLVLEAFVGPCPEGMVGCHYDDNPTNNVLSIYGGTLIRPTCSTGCETGMIRMSVRHTAHMDTSSHPRTHPHDGEAVGNVEPVAGWNLVSDVLK